MTIESEFKKIFASLYTIYIKPGLIFLNTYSFWKKSWENCEKWPLSLHRKRTKLLNMSLLTNFKDMNKILKQKNLI